MPRPLVRLLACLGLLALAGHAATACDEPPRTEYGDPGALDRKKMGPGGVPALACGQEVAAGFPGGCPSFAAHLHPNVTGKWRCIDSDCHGGKSSPLLDGPAPESLLASLKRVRVDDVPYLPQDPSMTDPKATKIMCNLQGLCGRRMPEPPGADLTVEELCVVEAWVKCGAPP